MRVRMRAQSAAGGSPAEPPASPEAFLQMLAGPALQAQARYGIPAAVILAQAALETGWGKKVVRDAATGQVSNNLFNIVWTGAGAYVEAADSHYEPGKGWRTIRQRFRAYPDYQASLDDYCALLTQAPRYRAAMSVASDPFAFADALQQAGYATDPLYAEKLKSIMRKRVLPVLQAWTPPSGSGREASHPEGSESAGERRSGHGGGTTPGISKGASPGTAAGTPPEPASSSDWLRLLARAIAAVLRALVPPRRKG